MPSYTVTQLAESDVKSVGRYTDRVWGRRQRVKYLKGVGALFERLADSPDFSKDYGDVLSGCLGVIYQHHIVFYIKTSDGVQIIRVLHQSMDIDSHLPSL